MFNDISADMLIKASYESLYMIGVSLLFAIVIGIPIGVLLAETRKDGILQNKFIYSILQTITNILRSIPFIILLVAILPLTKFIVGTSIGTTAAIVPLSLYIIPFSARLVEQAILEINPVIIECAKSMHAKKWQIIWFFILPEATPAIVLAITNVIIGLISASSMAGTIGGGGIGDLAISQGYERFNTPIIFVTVIILVILVNVVQFIGNFIYKKIKH